MAVTSFGQPAVESGASSAVQILSAADKLVMIIRHAEKPVAERPDLGVNEVGESDDKSLTVRGWQRAGGLICLFSNPPRPLRVPGTIFAAAPIDQDGGGGHSLRPSQKISALARRLGIEPNITFSKGHEEATGPAIAQQSGAILVCWQHESIPRLAASIVGSTKIAPLEWDDDNDYAAIWLLGYSSSGAKWTFGLAQQGLLDGDRRKRDRHSG